MSVVTISREIGCNSREIATRAAGILGYHVVDKELITDVARELRHDDDSVAEMDEDGPSGIRAFLHDAFARRSHLGDLLVNLSSEVDSPAFSRTEDPYDVHVLDRAVYFKLVRELVWDLWRENKVIILGRGAGLILRDMPNVVHIRVEAAEEFRADNLMMQSKTLSLHDAMRRIRASDHGRAAFMRRHFHVDWRNRAMYHAIINVQLSSVVAAARAHDRFDAEAALRPAPPGM